jgi:membrane-associated phospholipid phosphatase
VKAVALLHPRSVLFVTVAFFVALAAAAALAGVLPADAVVREALLDLASPVAIKIMRVVNAAGDWRLLLPGTALLFVAFPRARARWGLWVGLMVVAAVVPDVLKILIGRHRPEGVSLGFPSGHSAGAAAYFGAVMYLAGSLRPPARVIVRAGAMIMIVLVAVARVMLRAHWPSDTVGGIAFGLALASAAALLASAPPPDA